MIIRNKFNGYGRDGVRLYFKGGGGTSTTTQNIPTELKPLATEYSNKAIELSKQGYTPYSDTRYADLNNYQNAGLQSIYDRATNGSSTVNAGNQMVTDTLNGNYLNSNPYLDASFQAQSGAVTDAYNDAVKNVDSTAARAGAFGGSAWGQMQQDTNDTLAKNLGNLSTNVYANNYATERANQLNSANQGLQYGNQSYTDASQLMNAGNTIQDQTQQGLDFNYQQFQEQRDLPYKQLAAMGGVFDSYPSSQTTKSSGGGK